MMLGGVLRSCRSLSAVPKGLPPRLDGWEASVVEAGAAVVAAHEWRTKVPSDEDVACLEEHQLRHRTNTIGVPATPLCRQGYPQATLQDPSRHKFGAGLLRLTCPHLCEAIDAWESEDAVRTLSRELLVDGPDVEKNRASLDRTNERHARTRRALMNATAEDRAVARLGRSAVDYAMTSGIAGLSRDKLHDLKCLHAQVADELLSGDNALGKAILRGLEDRGVDLGGTDVCHHQCSGCQDGWSYTPVKNKQKLWATKARRQELQERRRRGLPTSLGPLKELGTDPSD